MYEHVVNWLTGTLMVRIRFTSWGPSKWILKSTIKFQLSTLPETNKSPLKISGWKMIHSFWGLSAYFQGRLLLVSGSVDWSFRVFFCLPSLKLTAKDLFKEAEPQKGNSSEATPVFQVLCLLVLGRVVTLPETNSSHLEMDGWNTSFLFGLLGQWLNLAKLLGITYLVGKISRSKVAFFQGPGRLSELGWPLFMASSLHFPGGERTARILQCDHGRLVFSNEQWKNRWLVRVYRGLYYPVI